MSENDSSHSEKNIEVVINKLNSEIENIEEKYISEHYKQNYQQKINIDKLIGKINIFKSSNIDPDLSFWKDLHKISLNKGGFLSIKNRREIYGYILDTLRKRPEFHFSSETVSTKEIKTYDLIIENDCKRSVFFSIIKNTDSLSKYKLREIDIENSSNTSSTVDSNDKVYENNQRDIKIYIKELMNFTKESLGNYEYFNYFQGYQEICLYFMIIFGRKKGVRYMSLFGKIYLDYVLSKKYKINFEMLIDILNECCNNISRKKNTTINKITSTKPYYSLSWIITYLTHSDDNLFDELRILDYFITSNISHIYFFCANIILSEFNKIEKKFNIINPCMEYMELFLQHFQKLKINLIDKQEIIKATEKINHNLFDKIILNMIKCSNENDKGTLLILNRKIHDISIFNNYSLINYFTYIGVAIVVLCFLIKYIFR